MPPGLILSLGRIPPAEKLGQLHGIDYGGCSGAWQHWYVIGVIFLMRLRRLWLNPGPWAHLAILSSNYNGMESVRWSKSEGGRGHIAISFSDVMVWLLFTFIAFSGITITLTEAFKYTESRKFEVKVFTLLDVIRAYLKQGDAGIIINYGHWKGVKI